MGWIEETRGGKSPAGVMLTEGKIGEDAQRETRASEACLRGGHFEV